MNRKTKRDFYKALSSILAAIYIGTIGLCFCSCINSADNSKRDEAIVDGIKSTDSEAQFTESIHEANICVFQSGWTKSKICIAEYHLARDKHIERREGYIYTDKVVVKLN